MQDYDKLVSLLLKKLDGSDEDVIFGTIALFTLEWKYNVSSNRGTTLVINNSSQKATIYNYGGSLSIRI